jgi:hypothetical protein
MGAVKLENHIARGPLEQVGLHSKVHAAGT